VLISQLGAVVVVLVVAERENEYVLVVDVSTEVFGLVVETKKVPTERLVKTSGTFVGGKVAFSFVI
jgi:hypothetical protein